MYYDMKEVRLYEKSSHSGSLLSAASRYDKKTSRNWLCSEITLLKGIVAVKHQKLFRTVEDFLPRVLNPGTSVNP